MHQGSQLRCQLVVGCSRSAESHRKTFEVLLTGFHPKVDVLGEGGRTVEDLDLDREEDRTEWRRRLAELSAARLASARARLEHLGIIDAEGQLVSKELPPDMLPDSDTTLETG